VEFRANGQSIGTVEAAPYTFAWNNAPAGCYDITAVAVDDAGTRTTSNNVRLAVGLVDLARGKPVTASSGKTPEKAVDGDYHSAWSSDNTDDAWIYVDLGAVHTVERVNLLWGWKIHATDFTIDVARTAPDDPRSWTTVHSEKNRAYVTWEATDRVRFTPVSARYVRLHATRRANRQTWGGYQLTALEVPIPRP
jgi:hypothetical protein